MEEVEDMWREGSALSPSDTSMEKPSVQLEIPPRWMLWRVYHPAKPRWDDPWAKYYDEEYKGSVKDEGRDLQTWWDPEKKRYVRSNDPMDEEGFNETASFPSFKPDRDLFGQSPRSRTQRGWHYVKRWSPATHTIDLPPQAEYATGADIPPELFNNIVECLLEHSQRGRGLGALRLVCHHWERLCLRAHFRQQTVRNYEDVMERSTGLEKRREWGWPTYPVRFLVMHLDVTQRRRGWIHITQTKLVSMLDGPDIDLRLNVTITGPLPAGRRLTSVYLSSPCRSPWCPLEIRILNLYDLHFRKLDNLVRVLRELPFLAYVRGLRITWDSVPDVYPRATSFIPADPGHRYSNVTHYCFDGSPHLAAMLACALSPPGTPPIAQPDANLLCALASTFAPSRCPVSQRTHETIAMCNNAVHLGLAPTQSRSRARTVQVMVLEKIDGGSEDSSVVICWEIVAYCVERLVSRPNLFLIFPSLRSASAFRQDVAITKMPRLFFQGRLRFVVKKLETEVVEVKAKVNAAEKTWSLVEPDEDDSWRVLVTEQYTVELKWRATVQRVRELAARLPGH